MSRNPGLDPGARIYGDLTTKEATEVEGVTTESTADTTVGRAIVEVASTGASHNSKTGGYFVENGVATGRPREARSVVEFARTIRIPRPLRCSH